MLACRETYAADEALQKRESNKQDQDRLVIHLERQIEIQRSRLASQQGQKRKEGAKDKEIRSHSQDIAALIQKSSLEYTEKLLGWKEDVAELTRKDEQLQVRPCC